MDDMAKELSDIVRVVLCKDCKYRIKSAGVCAKLSNNYEPPVYCDEDDFCSEGEKWTEVGTMAEIVCKGCTNEKCPYAGHAVRTMVCPFEYKPPKQTNADKFRAMKDEEMVVWLAHITECPRCPARREHCGLDCHGAWLDWLKQEAQDAAD